jgi:hypothetical protein
VIFEAVIIFYVLSIWSSESSACEVGEEVDLAGNLSYEVYCEGGATLSSNLR